MTKKQTLTADDKRLINHWNEAFGRAIEALEKAKQLSVGDFLVLYTGDDEKTLKLHMNSYGAPTKYKVVHSNQYGIPFIKKVNKKGTPIGPIMSCAGNLETDDYRYAGQYFEFRLDPDFADSLLLQEEYDPSQLHKTKQEIFKSVTKHNKAAKVDTSSLPKVVAFFQNLKIGDTLWASHSGYYLIQDIKIVNSKIVNNSKSLRTSIRGPFVQVLTVRDKNNKCFEITADFFAWKALYKERPRTYKELKI